MRKKRISKNRNYKIGRNFEYRVKRHFEEKGYFVVRSYASKGPADLYCMKPHGSIAYKNFMTSSDCEVKTTTELLLIQCKNYKGKLKDHEIEGLQLMAQATGGTPIHIWKDNNTRNLNLTKIQKKKFNLSFRGILDRLKELKKRLIKK